MTETFRIGDEVTIGDGDPNVYRIASIWKGEVVCWRNEGKIKRVVTIDQLVKVKGGGPFGVIL